MSLKKLPLAAIRIDADTQSRIAIDDATVADYAEALARGDKLPPFDVFHDGSQYYVADGFHRFLAHKRRKTAIVDIEMHEGTVDDARWFSAGANVAHGLKRTNADKRRAVELALRVQPSATDRAIADHCRVSHDLVAEVRKAVLAKSPTVEAKRVGKDGREYAAAKPPRTPPVASDAAPRKDKPPATPQQSTPLSERYEAARQIAEAQSAAAGGTPIYQDCVGRAVPADLNDVWQAREDMEGLVNQVHDVRMFIEDGHATCNRGLQRIGATVMAALQRCEQEIREAMPYALCPVCQGVGCQMCRQTGFVGKLVYDTAVPDGYKQ